MKTMNCKQLGGACDATFSADNWEDMARQSQEHGKAMQGDSGHQEAMSKMSKMMKNPEAMQKWMDEKEQEFNNTPDDE